MSITGRRTKKFPEIESLHNTNKKCQKGGEGVGNLNSELLRGVFTSNLVEGGVVGQSQSRRKTKNILVTVVQPQNWYQNLRVFRAIKIRA